MTELWFFNRPKQLIVENLAIGFVETEHREFRALGIRICNPDSVTPDHGRRPGLALQGGFPSDILSLIPYRG